MRTIAGVAALGELGHYAADNTGHPEAVNRAVALMYPKLRAKYGNSVTYADAPAKHVLVEFAFDIVQAAKRAYVRRASRSASTRRGSASSWPS